MATVVGKDHSIRLWTIPEQQATQSIDTGPLGCAAVYKGHTDAVEAVAASPSGGSFCSGSWDANVHIWRTGESAQDNSHYGRAVFVSSACDCAWCRYNLSLHCRNASPHTANCLSAQE